MNGSGWKYSTRAASSAPKTAGNGAADLPQAFLVQANHGHFRKPRFQALGDIADFMVNGGGNGNFAGDGLAGAFQPQIHAALAVQHRLFNDTAETKLLRRLFDAFLNGLVLCSAPA